MRDWRLERSARKVDADEDMVSLGMMVSFWIVARIPRCELEVMRLPTADLSSWEAMGVVSGVRGWNALEDRYRRYQTASWQVSTALYSVVVGTLKEEAAMLLNALISTCTLTSNQR